MRSGGAGGNLSPRLGTRASSPSTRTAGRPAWTKAGSSARRSIFPAVPAGTMATPDAGPSASISISKRPSHLRRPDRGTGTGSRPMRPRQTGLEGRARPPGGEPHVRRYELRLGERFAQPHAFEPLIGIARVIEPALADICEERPEPQAGDGKQRPEDREIAMESESRH